MTNGTVILGAGITGLSCAYATDIPVYEARDIPGGICASYYIGRDQKTAFSRTNPNSYRFEIGGGHWIFGVQGEVLNFLQSLSPLKNYQRRAAVYLRKLNLFVPYPIQNHLYCLPSDIRQKALREIMASEFKETNTLADWLIVSFGKTLCQLFFYPFHELYTTGLYTWIAPQDKFKSPVDKELIKKGAAGETKSVGYNTEFYYPEEGLDRLIGQLTEKCKVNYGKEVVKIDINGRKLVFSDGSITGFDKIISTLPLDRMLTMAGMVGLGQPDPYTAVLVFNIGAKKGSKAPKEQWLYITESRSGFHRVGFYSNVDSSFLPADTRKDKDRFSIYVEKAYLPHNKPSEKEIKRLGDNVVMELQEWGFIGEAEVISPTWIDNGYTWQSPASDWKEKAVERLKKVGIIQTGRYGKWHFQGISESVKDGMEVRSTLHG
jgi:protoporphyrinogen oxidase